MFPTGFLLYCCVVLGAALAILACGKGWALAGGGNYTVDLPTVDLVRAKIQGSDETDTSAANAENFGSSI